MGGPDSAADAWESTPDGGADGGGAIAAIDLYYSTQMRLLRDVMAELNDDGADAEDGTPGATEAEDWARKRRRRGENERGGGVLE